MKTRGKTFVQETIFKRRIYFIFLAVAFHCIFLNVAISQEIGAYRTIGSGNFGNIAIWQSYDGEIWSAATLKPSQANDIYIDQTHLLTLNGNEEVKSLYINAEAGANQKLNLNNFNLNLYGTIQGFSGAAPGVSNRAWNSINWIGNSASSTLTFKGGSRIITPYNTWTAQSDRSRFSVIFDPGSGIQLVVEEAFKALSFTIMSGSVYQKLDYSVNPGKCASFSFNTETTEFGPGAFGDLTIVAGATLISDCDKDILFRSSSLSANLFDLQSGGELILKGSSPQMEAANFQLNGKVTFNRNSSTQNFLSKSYTSSALPLTFHDLEIQGSQNVSVPASLSVSGNISKVSAGAFNLTNTGLNLIGSSDQNISGFAMNVRNLIVDKPFGKVNLEQNLQVSRNLTMLNGQLNFQDNQLTINASGSGIYNYTGGSWENLSKLNYLNTPTNLSSSNATFPFGDRYHGGIRKVQILGTNAGGNLNIIYTEYKGADFNPGFNDNDINNTPIIYRLFSYFQFSGLAPTSNPLELRISADKLVVDEPEDLRLVCTGYAAPGSHIESSDPANLWAIRKLTFDEVINKNFTVGSFRELSILPVNWLSLTAIVKDNLGQVIWSVAQEKDNERFEIYRSTDPMEDWTKIGEVLSKSDSEIPVSYTFIDKSISHLSTFYYQIRQIDYSGKWAWSHVVRLENQLRNLIEQLTIFPNPHSTGKIVVLLPKSFNLEKTQVTIHTIQGALISSFSFNEVEFSDKLQILNPGLYLITFSNEETSLQTRWIKR